ncbi:MAG: gluconate 2-dehydrogenase subunit 3 family protein [Gemmatimonadaceae bacterium]
MTRREMLQLLALTSLASLSAACDRDSVERASSAAASRGADFEPEFFDQHEWETVRVLVDAIIPRDERSGSATDAGVPEFMDFMMIDRPDTQTAMRGGLAWLDAECHDRFGKAFAACAVSERKDVLDDIAWPERARPEMSNGVAFFNGFRDLTASGFWSSKMGVADLDYRGNTAVAEWTGCPEPALRKLGVSYDGASA